MQAIRDKMALIQDMMAFLQDDSLPSPRGRYEVCLSQVGIQTTDCFFAQTCPMVLPYATGNTKEVVQ